MRASVKALLLGVLFIASSCCRSTLSVVDHYITIQMLPSFHVGTPDPQLCCPTLGQRLIIRWNLGSRFGCYEKVYINISLRYYNKEEAYLEMVLDRPKGHSHYDLLNDDYFCKGGIQSYKLEMYGDGVMIACWQHQLWADLIEIKDEDLECDEEEFDE